MEKIIKLPEEMLNSIKAKTIVNELFENQNGCPKDLGLQFSRESVNFNWANDMYVHTAHSKARDKTYKIITTYLIHSRTCLITKNVSRLIEREEHIYNEIRLVERRVLDITLMEKDKSETHIVHECSLDNWKKNYAWIKKGMVLSYSRHQTGECVDYIIKKVGGLKLLQFRKAIKQ